MGYKSSFRSNGLPEFLKWTSQDTWQGESTTAAAIQMMWYNYRSQNWTSSDRGHVMETGVSKLLLRKSEKPRTDLYNTSRVSVANLIVGFGIIHWRWGDTSTTAVRCLPWKGISFTSTHSGVGIRWLTRQSVARVPETPEKLLCGWWRNTIYQNTSKMTF